MNLKIGVLFFCLFFSSITWLSSQELSVLSYNIRYNSSGDGPDLWDLRKNELIAQISALQPTHFGVQEATKTQMDDLTEGLPNYNFIGVGRDDGATQGEYSAIFYQKSALEVVTSGTFWLSPTPEVVSVGWDAALPRICTYAKFKHLSSAKTFWHFNTHYDHMGKQARGESSNLILTKITSLVSTTDAVLLSGDLNAEPFEPPVISLLRSLQDPAHKFELSAPIGTFNGFDLDAIPKKRIDYIFYQNLDIIRYEHLRTRRENGRWISDHLPVLLRYRLR